MTTGPEIVGMICFARQEFVQNMMRIVQYVRKKVVIGVSSQLSQRGVVGCVKRNITWLVKSTTFAQLHSVDYALVGHFPLPATQ